MKKLSITLALLIAGATVGGDQENRTFWLHEWVHPVVAEAGHPACDPNQPKRPPCDMKSCMQIGPDGKKTGAKCSSYCAHGCCGCGDDCQVDFPGTGPNPDDPQADVEAYYFGVSGSNPDKGSPQIKIRILVMHPPK